MAETIRLAELPGSGHLEGVSDNSRRRSACGVVTQVTAS